MYADEIIRQVTVNCAERGSMLIRVRDEIKNNLDSYQKLYESVIAFGIRKSLLVIDVHREISKKLYYYKHIPYRVKSGFNA